MRLIVTGASGFVGAHVARGLLDDGHEVGTLLRASSSTDRIDPRATVLRHDGSTEGLFETVHAFAPDGGVHLATRFVAQHTPADIEGLVEANLLFGCQLLDALSRCGVTRFVNIGTSWEHFETDDYNPASLYAATKYAFGDLCRFYADAHNLRTVTLKLSDTYGPDDPRQKLIALLFRIGRSGETLGMSPGGQAINFTHVEDIVDAVRIALQRIEAAPPKTFESFAARGDEQMTLREFVTLFEEVTGLKVNIDWGARPYRDREVMRPWVGQRLPGWAPHTPLREGLRRLAQGV